MFFSIHQNDCTVMQQLLAFSHYDVLDQLWCHFLTNLTDNDLLSYKFFKLSHENEKMNQWQLSQNVWHSCCSADHSWSSNFDDSRFSFFSVSKTCKTAWCWSDWRLMTSEQTESMNLSCISVSCIHSVNVVISKFQQCSENLWLCTLCI